MTYVNTVLKKEIIISELITVHYFEYMKDFVFHGESHDFWEFHYVDKGRVQIQAGAGTYELNEGDVIFHQPNEFHSIKSIGDKAPNLVSVSFHTTSSSMEFFAHKWFSLSKPERFLISRIILAAREAFSTPLHIPSVEQVLPAPDAPFGSQQLVSLYLELFFISIKRSHSTEGSGCLPLISAVAERPLDSVRINQIIQYMQLHLCEQLTLEQICKEFSLSRSALQTLFHREKHCGAMDYFNKQKLELAGEIIRNGQMNLTEIAHYLSYSSLQYFSKQFKKATGMSPLYYSTSVKGMTQTLKKQPSKIEDNSATFSAKKKCNEQTKSL